MFTPQQYENFFNSIDKTGECWLWNKAKAINGYGITSRDNKSVYAHRLAYEMFREPIKEGAYCLHSCNKRSCCNPAHLRVGTAKENSADRIASGYQQTVARGKSLSDDEIKEIFASLEAGNTAYQIARRPLSSGRVISQQNICALKKRRSKIDAKTRKQQRDKVVTILDGYIDTLKSLPKAA